MNYRFLSSILLLLTTISIFGQFTESGQDPASVNWRQINTEKYLLVYDSCFEKEAQRIAAILDYSSQLTGNTLNQKHKKVPILIHNHSIISNGSVTLVPKRMEFYSVPPQNMYAQDWFEQLSIHEGRHWSQMKRFDRSTVSYLKILFGESFWGISAGQAHMWFLEGDAVTTETALTKSGRGRLPSFEMGIRAHMMETHRPYAFRKSVFGSYEDYIPNHYELGYLMVAYNRAKYGPQLWENTLNNIGINPLFAPFLLTMIRQTGKTRAALYNQTFFDLDSLWTLKSKEINYTSFKPVNDKYTRNYTSYRSAFYTGNIIIALKSGMDDITRVVQIDRASGEEKILFTPGYIPSERIEGNDKYIFWEEYVPDIRWEQRNYSVIKRFEISTGKTIQLTNKTRYFAPALSPNGEQLVVVESDIVGNNSLVILDASSGKSITRFATPANAAIQLPCWHSSGDKVMATLVDSSGKSLVMFSIKNNIWETIIPASSNNISQPRCIGNYIFFNASYSGIDNLYAVDITSKDIFQVTSSRYGAFDPMPFAYNDSILYTNYTSRGHKLAIARIDSSAWIPLAKVKNVSLNLADEIAKQEPAKYLSSAIAFKQYNSKPYNKFTHLVNIHSWIPFYPYYGSSLTVNSRPMWGYYVMSQNLLSTFIATGGQGYYKGSLYNELSVAWKGWFPVIEAGIRQGDTIGFINNTQKYTVNGKQFLAYAGISFPLNLSRGTNVIGLTPSYTFNYENSYFESYNGQFLKGINNSRLGLNFSAYEKPGIRDIAPRKGVSANIFYYKPVGNTVFSSQNVIITNAYLPGFFRHHSIMLTIAHEDQKLKGYFEKNRLETPRGYMYQWDSASPVIKKMGQIAFDYLMPLAYPDYTFLKVIYIKRLSASVYAEVNLANVYENKSFYNRYFSSGGVEMYAQCYFFFIPAPIEIGLRYAYVFKDKQPIIEPLLRISLSGL